MTVSQMARNYGKVFMESNRIGFPLKIGNLLVVLGIEAVYAPLRKVGALTLFNEYNDKLIVVNRDYDIETQRFLIAHEISHIILGHQGSCLYIQDSYYSFTYNKFEEYLSDVCAREILMPEDILREMAFKFSFDVSFLKDMFWVPELEMIIRLNEMGLPYWNTGKKTPASFLNRGLIANINHIE